RFASPEPIQRFQQPQPQPDQPGFAGEADEGGDAQAPAPQGEQVATGEEGQQFNAQQGGEGGEGRRHRDRNRRRRGRGNGEGGQSGDPAAAPQPDVGELPAFLTAGGTTTVAE